MKTGRPQVGSVQHRCFVGRHRRVPSQILKPRRRKASRSPSTVNHLPSSPRSPGNSRCQDCVASFLQRRTQRKWKSSLKRGSSGLSRRTRSSQRHSSRTRRLQDQEQGARVLLDPGVRIYASRYGLRRRGGSQKRHSQMMIYSRKRIAETAMGLRERVHPSRPVPHQ